MSKRCSHLVGGRNCWSSISWVATSGPLVVHFCTRHKKRQQILAPRVWNYEPFKDSQ